MSRLVIGFGSDGEFRNDIADQADQSFTVVAGPNEVVTVTDGQVEVIQDDDTN
ncbi:hypothetical protein [Streptomyces nigrescens]